MWPSFEIRRLGHVTPNNSHQTIQMDIDPPVTPMQEPEKCVVSCAINGVLTDPSKFAVPVTVEECAIAAEGKFPGIFPPDHAKEHTLLGLPLFMCISETKDQVIPYSEFFFSRLLKYISKEWEHSRLGTQKLHDKLGMLLEDGLLVSCLI
jgi:hypothetical protein